MAEAVVKEGLFSGVHFYIVQSAGLDADLGQSLTRTLEARGASAVSPISSQGAERIPLDSVTHIVADNIDFPEYRTASDRLKAVVKPAWIHASINKARLANPQQYSADPRQFYSGMVVTCADLPTGDSDAVIGGVIALGGLYSSAVTKQVTHIVALSLDSEKCNVALAKGVKCKIVLPHWFDDCLKLGRRIDEEPYTLPNPTILGNPPNSRIIGPDRSDLSTQNSPRPRAIASSLQSEGREQRKLTVFRNKTVMLHPDLNLNPHLLDVLRNLITANNGELTDDVQDVDYLICQYRDSIEYRIASRAGRDVGNLSWLYHLLITDTWSSPMRRLLHYPISPSGLPGFKHFRISLSNYNGEARIYLENLAIAAGCEFTRTMKEDNTHLITAHTFSEKCDAAKEWNIHMINHLWLEESYAQWQVQSLANPRYTQFPSQTNLGEVVGQTSIDYQAVERCFFPPGSDHVEDKEESAIERPKSGIITSHKERSGKDKTDAAKMHPQSSPSGAASPSAAKLNRRAKEVATVRTPAQVRLAPGKENEVPPSTGSRSAKQKATAKLHDLASDIALFEKERKRVGGVTHGGKRNAEDLVQTPAAKRRSLSVDREDEDDSDQEQSSGNSSNRRKTSSLPPPMMRLAISGYKRWTGMASKKEAEERSRLREMGILIVSEPRSCSHLAAPRIIRTEKFVCAMASAPEVISTDFLDDCLANNIYCDPKNYILDDRECESQLGFNLQESRRRAKATNGQLLRDSSIFCTENIRGGFDTYRNIVECNGGTCRLYRARAVSQPGPRQADNEAGLSITRKSRTNGLYLLSANTATDAKLWPRFRDMAKSAGMKPHIVNADWILNSALSQTFLDTSAFELSEDNILPDPDL